MVGEDGLQGCFYELGLIFCPQYQLWYSKETSPWCRCWTGHAGVAKHGNKQRASTTRGRQWRPNSCAVCQLHVSQMLST